MNPNEDKLVQWLLFPVKVITSLWLPSLLLTDLFPRGIWRGEPKREEVWVRSPHVNNGSPQTPPAQAQPVMKHHGDVIDLKVNSPQVSLGDNGQRAVLLQVEWHGISAQSSSSRIDRFSNSLQIPIKLGGQGQLCPNRGPIHAGWDRGPSQINLD